MSFSTSEYNLFEPWEIQPTKRRLCIGSDQLPYDFDIVPRHLLSYMSAFPELRRKNGVGMDANLKKDNKLKGTNEFQMCLNVSCFNPNEILIKVKGEDIIIECKHEERDDIYGSMARHYIKRFNLPSDYSLDNLSSNLSSDGILIIRAPKKSNDSTERIVEIQQTGPAYLNIKDNLKI